MPANSLRRPPNEGRDSGFTLFEVVVAMAIAALALVALFQVGSGGVMAVETAGRVEEAVERAHSHMAAIGRGTALAEGESEGDDGGGFRWRLSVHPLAAREGGNTPDGPPAARLFRVDVSISWQGRDHRRTVTLTTLRLQSSG